MRKRGLKEYHAYIELWKILMPKIKLLLGIIRIVQFSVSRKTRKRNNRNQKEQFRYVWAKYLRHRKQ